MSLRALHNELMKHLLTSVFALLLAVSLSGATDWSKKLPHTLKSRYFTFHYQSTEWDAPNFVRFADAFVDLVNRDFLPVQFDYPITVIMLPDKDTYQKFVRREFAQREMPDFGFHSSAFKTFVTYEDTGLGTFAHEIMHPLIDRNLPDAPRWASEAIPSFFEKFFGYWEGDELRAEWGYHNSWRLEKIGENLPFVDLTAIVTHRPPPNDFERRLVGLFLWRHGKFENFIRLIAARKRNGFPSYFEAAMEKPMKDILPLWQDYLSEIIANLEPAMKIPSSQILPDRAAFDRAMAELKPWRQERSPAP